MKKSVFLPAVALVSFSLLPACSSSGASLKETREEIQTILGQQRESWNEGNIEGFMEYYWKSENFTFQSGNNRLHGWESLLSRYKEGYSGEKRGTLEFTDIDIKVLSRKFAYVLGRWKLMFKDSSKEGLFTIIFQKMPEGWRIIHDHS